LPYRKRGDLATAESHAYGVSRSRTFPVPHHTLDTKPNLARLMKTLLHVLLLLCALVPSALGQSQSLDGPWRFAVDREGKWTINDLGAVKDWREIRVPLSWNAQFADLRDYRGVAWYRRVVDLAPLKADQTILLKFGAVDYLTEVFVNGQKAGGHEGGYLPFTLDVGRLVKAGANEIAVRVVDPDDDKARWGEMVYSQIPHGKQSWYVQTGGIWQSVTLAVKPKHHITDVLVTTQNDGSIFIAIRTTSNVSPPPAAPAPRRSFLPYSQLPLSAADLKIKILDPQGREVKARSAPGGGGSRNVLFSSLKIDAPQLWSTERASLYTLELQFGDDRFADRFGFRSFEARDGKFYLNSQPIYLISALDQDFYPEGIYTPPSYEFLVDQMRKAKQLGLNMLRTHIKVPTPEYLRAADEVGLLIWYEVPSWDDNVWTPAAARRGEEIFRGQLERDWNHPSVVIQSIINEAWGVNNLKEEHTRKWLKEAFNKLAPEAAKAGRLTVDNSPCCQNFHLKTHIADFHQYYSIPDNRAAWDKWVAELAARPAWLWSKHGDAEPTGKEPLMLSEFGNWGLPVLPDKLPWWFERDFNGREVTRPAGLFDRFHGYKFDRLFAGFNDLARATQRHQWRSLKYEIEEIRKHAPIQGYTITEFTDLNWECNGLLDMYRNLKVYAADMAKLQQQDVVLARPVSPSFVSTEKIELRTYVSRYSPAAAKTLTLSCYADGKRITTSQIKPATRGAVVEDDQLALTAPNVTKPTAWRVKLDVRDAANQVIAENYLDLFIYPEPKRQSGKIYLTGALAGMREALQHAGYTLVDAPSAEVVALTNKLDQQTSTLLQAGTRVIVLADDKDAFTADWPLKLAPRNGATGYDGNWVTNFNWANVNRAPFNAVAIDKLLGFEAEAVMPKFVIEGVKPADYDEVLSGIFLGWVNKNAALLVQGRMGTGRALLTTFRLAEQYGKDEYARHLLDAMIRMAADAEFNPRLELK
jgi:hypothetical protein